MSLRSRLRAWTRSNSWRVCGYAGICGSDLHLYYGPESPGMDGHTPHQLTGALPPQVLGHEFSGTVVELAEASCQAHLVSA